MKMICIYHWHQFCDTAFRCDDFQICQKVVNGLAHTLLMPTLDEDQSSEGGDSQRKKKDDGHGKEGVKTLFALYQEIAKASEVDSFAGIQIPFRLDHTENEETHINASYREHFDDSEWRRIQIFEHQFSVVEKAKRQLGITQKYLSILTTCTRKKWDFWNACKSGLELGGILNGINVVVCSYQKSRLQTGSVIDGIQLLVAGKRHLP